MLLLEGHQVRLELVDVDVEFTFASQRNGQRRDHLRNHTVKVAVSGPVDVETLLAQTVHSRVLERERDVDVVDQAAQVHHCVVGLADVF